MPPKTKDKTTSTRTFGSAKFTEYVYCPLPDDATAEAITTWATQGQLTGFNVIGLFYNECYRITIKQSGLDDTMCEVSAYDTYEGSPHAGKILTASADTIELALLALAYKHYVLLETNWGNATQERRRRSRLA